MIIDTLQHFEQYAHLNPLFEVVCAFLKENDLQKMADGKHLIQGEDLFVNIQTAKGKTPEEAVVETHRVMADIQIPLSGKETYGYIPEACLPDGDYNEEKDITKFPGVASQSLVTCQPGMFAIFFPQDGHAPCITEQPEIRKAIFKVKC
jgi:YhcH/YjgK/YiaL family protein